MHFNNNKHWYWLGFILFAVIYLSNSFYHGIEIETNILKLLPISEQKTDVQSAVDMISDKVGKKVVFLIGHKNKSKALDAASLFHDELNNSKLFSNITYSIESDKYAELYQMYLPYKNQLLNNQDRKLLSSNNTKSFIQNVQQKLYNPTSPLSSYQLEVDPFFNLISFLQEQNTLNNNLYLDSGQLITNYKDQYYVFMSADINSNTFSLDTQTEFKEFYKKATRIVEIQLDNSQILSMGSIHFTIEGTDSAKNEISLIGAGSLIGIIFIIFITFKSVTPLLLSVISILSGIIIGLFFCLLIFKEIHLFTLVFGSSLIGVSIDYSFHYFSEQLRGIDSKTTIKNIFPAISMGMASSAMAYLALSASKFPGLQQISIFSIAGLVTAYSCVLLFYPGITKSSNISRPGILQYFNPILKWWKSFTANNILIFILLSISILSTLLYLELESDDDVRNLRSASSEALTEESIVKNIISSNVENQFFLIQATSIETVLHQEEALYGKLDKLISDKLLDGYQGTAVFSPSHQRQSNNYDLLSQAVNTEHSVLAKHLVDIGYNKDKLLNYLNQFQSESDVYFELDTWLSSDISNELNFHWLGKTSNNSSYQSIVTLYGIHDISSLKNLSNTKHITLVDYIDDISNTLKTYRESATSLIFFAYLFIFILLCVRYGWYKSIFIISPPLIGALAALAIVMSIGIKINYFNSLAVILVLGIGIDYSLFYAEHKTSPEYTMLATLLSAITSILSFGLLALSNTPALHSFGLIVFTGISFVFLLSPMASTHKTDTLLTTSEKQNI